MQFLDDSLLPETQDKLVITVAPYGPEWHPDDFPEDIPLSTWTSAKKTGRDRNACRNSTS